MNRRLLATAFALAFGTAASPVSALDLVQAVQAATGIDPVVASSRSQLAAVRERVPQARAGLGPTASASAGINYNVADTSRSPARDWDNQSLGLLASYPVYRPATREVLAQSELAAQVAEVQLAQARQDLILRVAQAYFDVLAAQDSLTAVRAQKQAFTEQFASARRNFEVGTATVTDQQEAQARLDLTRAQEVAVENDLAVRRALLSQLIGRPVETLDTLRPGVEVITPESGLESEWAGIARMQNHAVRASELSAEIARREIERQRLGHQPTLDAVAQANVSRSGPGSTPTTPVDIRSVGGLVGLQFSLPLYTGGAVDARVREAIALQDKAQFDLDNSRRVAEQAARQTFLGVRSGLEQVRALTAAERSSQLALESNQLGYQVGVRINIDVLNAAQQLFSTQRDLARARYDVLLNNLRLKNTVGDLTEADVARVNTLLGPPPPPPPPPAAPAPEPAAAPPSAAPRPAAPRPAAPRPAAPRPATPRPAAPGTVPAIRGGRSATPLAPR